MLLDQRHEIGRRVARQRRLGEVRIGRDEVCRRAVKVGEIAAPAAGDKNFLSQPLGAFEDGHPPSPLAGFDGTHQSGSAAAENQSVIFMDQEISRAGKSFLIGGLKRKCVGNEAIVTRSSMSSNRFFANAVMRKPFWVLDVVEQRHEAKIHMELLMTMKQRKPGLVRREINVYFLIAADHHHIFHHSGHRLAGIFESVRNCGDEGGWDGCHHSRSACEGGSACLSPIGTWVAFVPLRRRRH